MKPFLTVLGALALSLATSQAMAALSPADKAFATKAAADGQSEITLGRLAAQNAESPKVKAFAQRMVADHTEASQALQEIARQQNLTLSVTPTSADQAAEQRLRALRGKAFDTAYMHDVVQDHREDVVEFGREAKGGTDPTVKAFAQKTLPVLEQHLRMAQNFATAK